MIRPSNWMAMSSQRRFTSAALLGLALGSTTWLASLATARPEAPTDNEQRIALLVSALMDRHHLSDMRVNDEISQRALEMFFKQLDPMKLYFMQEDIDSFAKERTRIDDYIRRGDVRLANRIFELFLLRVDTSMDYADKFIDEEHDYSVDETFVRDPDEIPWAKNTEEIADRWRKRVKYELLLQTADDVEDADAKEKLHKRYKSIRRRWNQTDKDELLELFLSAVTMSFDPHSSYMSPNNLKNFKISLSLSLDGIGASLESRYGETIVRRIVPGGAADKDGRLQVDDVITAVGQGTSGEMIDIAEMKLTDVVEKIRGKPQTTVRLEVKPSDGTTLKVLDIVREHIELKDSEARSEVIIRDSKGQPLSKQDEASSANEASGKILEQSQANGGVFRIGVIDLPSFYMDMEARSKGDPNYKSTTRDVRTLLEDFNKQNVDVVIVDLRFNGGGSLPESVDTTGLFIDQGPIVQVKGPDGRVQPYDDDEAGAVWTKPVVVVINKFSASASEIFAGAIQDYGRGIVVGDRTTHGKGTVQQLTDLGRQIMPIKPPNYGALKLTIQQFYRPGGDSTQNRGVVSDIELPSRTTHWEVGEADLDYPMKFDRVRPLPHQNYPFAAPQAIDELRRRSQERVAESEYFAKELKSIERYLERKENPVITLNKEKFLAERAELNTEKEQEDMFDDLQANDQPVFAATPYNEELIAIALDYLEVLGDARLVAR